MKRAHTLVQAIILSAILGMLLGCGASAAATPLVAPATPVTATAASSEMPPALAPAVSPTAAVEPTPSATPITISGLSPISYRLPLTVQHVTPTTATLFFELDSASEGVVLVAPVEQPGQQIVVALDPAETRQQITLENLTPGLRYQATVGLGLDPQLTEPAFREGAWGSVTFRTPSDAEPLRIGVLGDSGFGEQITFDLAAHMAAQDLDFTIHTGDVVYRVYDNPDAYDAYALKWYLPLQPLLEAMPVYPVVGNHDVEEAARWNGVPFYYLAFPSFAAPPLASSAFEGRNQWYAVGYGALQFLMLDTQVFYNEPGRAEQEAWLAERLSDPVYEHTIVALHVPPFSSGSVHPNDGYPVRSWVPLFEGANVPLVLSGHSHNYERLSMNGVTYVITGGGSSSLYGMGETQPGSQVYARRTHYVLLEVFSDRIDLTAAAVTGETLDQVSIPLP